MFYVCNAELTDINFDAATLILWTFIKDRECIVSFKFHPSKFISFKGENISRNLQSVKH